ncbi:MAG: DUF4202 domain-containing protein [Chryseosolibacter sp.]
MAHDRFEQAMAAFDAYHQKDPNTEMVDGKSLPGELLYAQRITTRLADVAPDAGEAVRLAARCQHIGRWEIPREKYPMDRKGYLQWRNEEKAHHARIAEKILSVCGYDQAVIDKVKLLVLKKELYSNEDTQLLEDVVCLVFVEHYLEAFAAKHDDDKVVDILQKTMKKMSAAGKHALTQLKLSPKILGLIKRATSSS